MEVEVTVWSVNAATTPAAVLPVADVTRTAPAATTGTRVLFDAAQGEHHTASIHLRSDFSPGAFASGPAVITEDETTIVLPATRTATATADGCIDIHRKEP